MAKRYEGSKADKKEDARGARASGLTRRDYEKSARDKREDAAGQKRLNKQPTRGIRKFDDGGSVSSGSSSGATTTSSASPNSYYGMLANMSGSLGGSKSSPYASTSSGGNPYFRKGGKVGSKGKRR